MSLLQSTAMEKSKTNADMKSKKGIYRKGSENVIGNSNII
jgi:hypothetical protein